MLFNNLEDVLTLQEITQLKNTHNLQSTNPKLVNWIAQTLNFFPITYEYAIREEAKDSLDDIENPLKTIVTIGWLSHAIKEGKLTYKNQPIRLKFDDYLVHHIWDFSFPNRHYSMCIESLYLFYQETHQLRTNFLSPDQLRIYPALKSNKPRLKGKQSSYLKVSNEICFLIEEAFSQNNLILPLAPQKYNPLDTEDVNSWLNSIMITNQANSEKLNQEIQAHIAQVQAVCQKYTSHKIKEKTTQPVWLQF